MHFSDLKSNISEDQESPDDVSVTFQNNDVKTIPEIKLF